MRKIISICTVLMLVLLLSGCNKQKVVFPDREAHMSYNSAPTSSEIIAKEQKEKQEKMDKVMNAEWKKNPNKYKLVALTFDDAPSYSTAKDNNTVKIIDAINKYEGAGTLFCIGKNIDTNGTALLSYAKDLGFELANHTYNHMHLNTLSKADIRTEIARVNDLLKERVGASSKFLRPGYGDVNDDVFSIATELNMPVIWTDVKGIADYSSESSADFIEERVVNGVKDGSIVLLHGNVKNTAEAMENICKRLYDDGYRFVTLSEMFEYKGIKNIPTDKMIENANLD